MTIKEKLQEINAESLRNRQHISDWKEENEMEEKLRWHDALTDNPKDVREYIVFVGSTNTYGEKYGFISFAKWCGHGWDRFGLLDQEAIPHVVEWIEWMPAIPDGYKQED